VQAVAVLVVEDFHFQTTPKAEAAEAEVAEQSLALLNLQLLLVQ